MTTTDQETVAVRLEALPSDRTRRSQGEAPVRITVTIAGEETEETVRHPQEVLDALDRILQVRIMGSAFSFSATVHCSEKSGVTTCRILQSIAEALNLNTVLPQHFSAQE